MGTTSGFLSVLRWPERSPRHPGEPFAEEDGVEILVEAAGLPPADALRAVRRGTPQIACLIDAAAAPAVLAALRRAGVTAAFVPRNLVESLPPPLGAKRLRPALGAPRPMYLVEPWRGAGEALLAADIALMVRATVRTTESRTERSPRGGATRAGFMVGGWAGAAAAGALAGETVTSQTRRTTTSELLDLHTAQGRCVRLDGDKFSFDVLGEEKGLTDRENMDRLADRLRREAPHAGFDADFERFAFPMQFMRERTWGGSEVSGRTATDRGAFEFYSAWKAALRREMRRAGRGG